MSAEEIANAFVTHFYQKFGAGGAAELAGLYVSKTLVVSESITVIRVHGTPVHARCASFNRCDQEVLRGEDGAIHIEPFVWFPYCYVFALARALKSLF
jgi:hypothetical protein